MVAGSFPKSLVFCAAVFVGLLESRSAVRVCLADEPAGKIASARPAAEKKVNITISKETTYLLGPLNADGTVNYVAAINEIYSKGVTSENNAAILLIKALGPEFLDPSVRGKVLERLGVALPAGGEYLMSLRAYVRAKMIKGDPRGPVPEVMIAEPDEAEIGAAQGKADRQLDKAMAGPWEAKDCPVIAGWLKANEKQLALVVEASRRRRFFLPNFSADEPQSVIATVLPCFTE
ncbi:MAG: hypothetical protein ACYTF6_13800, partial [Planctomycetota bacterium]